MKKLVCFLICSAAVLSLSSCGKGDNAKTETTALQTAQSSSVFSSQAQTSSSTEVAENTTVSQPDTLIKTEKVQSQAVASFDELNEQTGSKLSTPDVEGIVSEEFNIINEEKAATGEYIFKTEKYTCSVRFSKYTGTDISGYIINGKEPFDNNGGVQVFTDKNTALVHWLTKDGQYVLSYNEDDLDLGTFENLFNMMKEISEK
ncbi:MAG: hypothetical protein K6B52_02100 [Clostridiales bacterium]|nr:hypothetical protein [Clostridiales bacterium]